MKKAWMSWSSGKDSAMALLKAQQDPSLAVEGLFCTVNEAFQRVAMHGVRQEILEAQAKALGLPLEIIYIPYPCTNEQYEKIMKSFVNKMIGMNIEAFIFGDLFLEDIRKYRIDNLQPYGIEPLFPLWGWDTKALSCEICALNFQIIITCVDSKQLDISFSGRWYNKEMILDLPQTVDPCGENGEFHTLVVNAPHFSRAIPVIIGETVNRDGFIFTDVMLKENNSHDV